MKTQASEKRVEANRRNALKSTGPRTEAGREKAKRNAVTHGIFSGEVVVSGEDRREFEGLHARLVEDLKPVGVVEELLVDQVARAHWRLRRALAAEAAEIELSVERVRRAAEAIDPVAVARGWKHSGDPEQAMRACSQGNSLLEHKLWKLWQSVEGTGELTAAAVEKVSLFGERLALTQRLETLRVSLQGNPQGLAGEELRGWQTEQVREFIENELAGVEQAQVECGRREKREMEVRLATARLPGEAVVEKIVRYERMLERQIERGLGQLEKRRKGKSQNPSLKFQRREGNGTNRTEGTEGMDGELRNEANFGRSGGFQIGDFRFQNGEEGQIADGQFPMAQTDGGKKGFCETKPMEEGGTLVQEPEEIRKMGSEKLEGREQPADARLMAADAPSPQPPPFLGGGERVGVRGISINLKPSEFYKPLQLTRALRTIFL